MTRAQVLALCYVAMHEVPMDVDFELTGVNDDGNVGALAVNATDRRVLGSWILKKEGGHEVVLGPQSVEVTDGTED